MLLANYSILNRNTGALTGNAFTNPFARFNPTLFPSFYCGEANVSGETNKSSFNNGYAVTADGGSAWHLSPKAGGLACNMIYGTGTVSAALSMGKALTAALTGSGTISAASLALIVQLAAALTGSGTVSAATLQAVAGLSAALSGSGSISAAALSLIVALEADLSGSGTLSGTLRGTAGLSADIVVTGTGLTTANVGQAVWSFLLENGYTTEQAMSILTAVAAGKTDITGATVTFRDLADTKDVVVADMTGSERTTVTLDP